MTNFYSERRKDILYVLQKYWSLKQTELNEGVYKGDIYICERHYVEYNVEFTGKYLSYYLNELGWYEFKNACQK